MAFETFKKALEKTRKLLNTRVEDIFVAGRTLEEDELEELEEALIASDVGVDAASNIVEHMKSVARANKIPEGGPMALLRDEVGRIIGEGVSAKFALTEKPHVILLVGVNGTGKTTTAGKLARRIQNMGKRPLLAASDTFRAAASDQLEIWAERAGVEIVRSTSGADPASVAFDAVSKAVAGRFDAVIVDTAGRLHTKVNLMEELKKVSRVCSKKIPDAPHDVFLVLDATTGNNGIAQARIFNEAIGLTGIILTKLDSTAKGGIALAIMREIGVPVVLVGVGEKIDDLVDFEPEGFISGLFEA
ncbi:MAG TPA: signal recognition particle-docking protein FtsY [candidate division Zixibacteria bacterium]|nr:signal recognition particle-docking protein FtsY [candidate division Zixibacteria bacterium]